MESQWYYFPGQTPQNTKISDRAHALHITKDAWSNITQHLDRKKRIQEAIDREHAHKEALKQGSEEMTKKWPNSVQNLRLRKEEERRHRFEGRGKEDKTALYYKMRAEQEAVRKEYIDKIKKEVFISQGYPKELTSALILSETLYEREKQKEFRSKIKQHDIEVKNRFDADIVAADAKYLQDKKEQEQIKRQKARKEGEFLRNQIKEHEETEKRMNRAHIEKEIRDRIKAAEEEELIKQYELDIIAKKRKEIAIQRKKAMNDKHKRQQLIAKDEEEMEQATKFYSEARQRIDCMMKIKDKQMRDKIAKHQQELHSHVVALHEARDAAEKARLDNAIAQMEANDKAKAEAKANVKAKNRRERIEDREEHFRKQEREKEIDNEMKKWEMLNRMKTAETMKEHDAQNRKNNWEKILQYRRDLLEQMADDRAAQKREKEIDEIMSHVSYDEADKMFFDYANEVLEMAKSKNRSIHPIEKVIADYKKTNNLSPRQRPRCVIK
ncbi:hypothetical protein Zmor_023238 [Zophobas morio]|uniref:Trichohyalin-plectin-homology domain-containing protein n=1 Tax=Zophobas morio TaxID=2755281 RepID=A0AA38HWQ9_9CUCU|nr:hypothetical protein Zmor_023238 [Zophobas morio]